MFWEVKITFPLYFPKIPFLPQFRLTGIFDNFNKNVSPLCVAISRCVLCFFFISLLFFSFYLKCCIFFSLINVHPCCGSKIFVSAVRRSVTDLSLPCSLVHNPLHILALCLLFSSHIYQSFLLIVFLLLLLLTCLLILSPNFALNSPIIIDCWPSLFTFVISSVIDVYKFFVWCQTFLRCMDHSFIFCYLVVFIMSALVMFLALLAGYCFHCIFGCYYYSCTMWCLIIPIYGLIPCYCYFFFLLHMVFD